MIRQSGSRVFGPQVQGPWTLDKVSRSRDRGVFLGKGLIGEYTNLDLPNISTSLAYVLDLEVLTVITGSLVPFFLLDLMTC
jgi:hypothetical protein